jgi:hypothetical protein
MLCRIRLRDHARTTQANAKGGPNSARNGPNSNPSSPFQAAYRPRGDGAPREAGRHWSPDGSQIALVHEDLDFYTVGQPTTGMLVVVRAEGGQERQLARFQLSRGDHLGNVRLVTIAWNPAG